MTYEIQYVGNYNKDGRSKLINLHKKLWNGISRLTIGKYLKQYLVVSSTN